MDRRNTLRSFLRAAILIFLVVILPLAGGYFLSLHLIPPPQIAVIRIEGDILGDYTAYLSTALDEVANDRAIRAVVLDIASPGGEVTASESLYLDVLNLRERKPVIASIDELAASGAYYMACAADRIYAKAASQVGNIGAISLLPASDQLFEDLMTTGPFKLTGASQVARIRHLEMLKDAFLIAVMAQRGDRLYVGTEVLSRGEIYRGLQAQQMGLIDEIGSQRDAIAASARMARVRHYDIVDRTPELPEASLLFGFKLQEGSTATTIAAPPANLPPGFYYRYLEPPQ
jgi:protease-4